MHPLKRNILWLGYYVILSSLAQAETLIQTKIMAVNATIHNGCSLNSSVTGGVELGTIHFGRFLLNQPLYAVSAENAGSIILRCTPNTAASIALNAGNNTQNIATGRRLKDISTGATLSYQLYQDVAYSKIWGDNYNGANSMTVLATGGKDVFTVYAKLMPVASYPAPGDYRDTIIVTVSY